MISTSMPQVDLETLVSACAGGGSSMDRKIACETQACDGENPPETISATAEEVTPDFPPESFWLSKDAEHDWFDRNAFFERKESQKGNNSNSTNLNPNIVPGSHSNSNSQRFSMNIKSKAAIIGLPKGQKSYAVEAKHRKNSTTRLFPKKKNGLSATAMAEPSSPKVSCMGRVRSKKDRNPRSKKKSPESPPETTYKWRTGFFATFRSIFQTGCREKPAIASSRYTAAAESERSEESPSERGAHAHPRRSVEIEPPGLGGLNRFASGRRSSALVDGVA